MRRLGWLAVFLMLLGTLAGATFACGGDDDDDNDADNGDDTTDDDDDVSDDDDASDDDVADDDDTVDDDTADDDTGDDDDGWYGEEPCEGDMVCFNVWLEDSGGTPIESATIDLVDGCLEMNPLPDLPTRTESNITEEDGYTWLTYDCIEGEIAFAASVGFCMGTILDGTCPRTDPLIVNMEIQTP